MARTIAMLTPGMAETKTTTFPQPGRTSDASGARPYLGFDAATDEAAYFTIFIPVGFTAPLTVVSTYAMASATSGNVIVDVAIDAISDGDGSPDTDAAESLDTANTSAATAVPGTAGLIDQLSIACTNGDSAAAGDYARIRIRRVGSSGSDTATGDLNWYGAEVRDAT